MIRTFQTTTYRTQQELTTGLWEFRSLSGDLADITSKKVLPSCWETYPGYETYRGEAVYSRKITLWNNFYSRLVCKGISHTAEVYVDGKKLASHYNAYTPFECIIPPSEHRKEQLLEIKVSNAYGDNSSLHIPNDYESYGGISRPILLERVASCYIKWMHITPEYINGSWQARVEVCIENLTKGQQNLSVETTLAKSSARQEKVVCAAQGETKVIFVIHPETITPWSMESPSLYLCKTSLFREGALIDDFIDRMGFRTVTVKDNQILLNDRPVYIKGFCRHEDHALFGCALPFEAMAYDLELLKELGANSVRTSHYPNDERFLDLCDELGILVWEENHARGLSEEHMKHPLFEQQCEDGIREMITAHYNHPSIYVWGILNECANHTEFGAACYEKQYEQIQTLDRSRPRTSAGCHFKLDKNIQTPEIKAYNIYPGWYHDRTTKEFAKELYEWIRGACKKEVPFLISEIGAGAIYGYRDNRKTKWSEEYQAQVLREQIEGIYESDFLNGMYLWQFCDVRVSDEWFSNRPRTMNNKGVVDEFRRKKAAFDTVKELFLQRGNYRT